MKILISKYQNPLVITVTLFSEENPLRVNLFQRYFPLNLYLEHCKYIDAAAIVTTKTKDVEAEVYLLPTSDPRDVTAKIQCSLGKMVTEEKIHFFYSKETTDSFDQD